MIDKLESYKGVPMRGEALNELMDKIEAGHDLMSIVFALLNDDQYTKADAAKGILDVMTGILDPGFVDPRLQQSEQNLLHENYELKQQLANKR